MTVGVFGQSRFREGPLGSRPGVRYPSPFFDMGQTYLPNNQRDLLQWCRYYFLTHPLINAVTFKMAEYPVTSLVFKTDDDQLRRRYVDLSENVLNLRPFAVEVGLDYNCYGNAFVSVHFPFRKYLVCPECRSNFDIKHHRGLYQFRNLKYYLKECPRCGYSGEAGIHDHYIPSVREIRLVRWNPENIDVEYNETIGAHMYYYRMPLKMRNDITVGKRSVIEEVPDIYIEMVRTNKSLVFNPDALFHLKRPTIAQKDQGWGMPMILPALKNAYYMQILNKGQEMIAQEHIVPLRVLFPQAGSGSSDPYTNIDISKWAGQIEKEIMRWKLDKNHIPVLPLPVGHQVIGGTGRAMVLHQELRVLGEFMVAGMGVPQEFVFGGLQYSGSNVSMRMLENHFLHYRQGLLHLLSDFILKRIAQRLEWPEVEIEFTRFKMADDLQRLFFFQQLNQAGKMSDRTLLIEADLDPKLEEKYMADELIRGLETQRRNQLGAAAVAGEAQLTQMRYTNKAQAEGVKAQMVAQVKAQGEAQRIQEQQATPQAQPGHPAPPADQHASPAGGALPDEGQAGMESQVGLQSVGTNVDVLTLARRAASYLTNVAQSDPNQAQQNLNFMRSRNPQLYTLVVKLLKAQQGGTENPLDARQQPMPEQRPPRRVPATG